MITIEQLRDFNYFSTNFLKIKKKNGSIVPFLFNKTQRHLHGMLEEQKASTGKVRAIILKGRQAGCSTYVEGRYFVRTITTRGVKTYIFAHEYPATKNLFEMTLRYYENLPVGLASEASRISQKELVFDRLDSSFSLGTAGSRATGRSQTIQQLHGSEVAFWPDAQEHAQGLMQAVSNDAGTEIILESTANGIGNYFHEIWLEAERGKSSYMPVFLPWYWEDDYKHKVLVEDANLTEEEEEIFLLHSVHGLTKEHLYWRRNKISEFSSDYDKGLQSFKQEYPLNAQEAFLNPVENIFIDSNRVMIARKAEVDGIGQLIIGVDPAISSHDRCAIIRRRGREAFGLEVFKNHNTMEIAGKLKKIIEQERPFKMFIDSIGIGAGVVDRLHEMGFSCVEGVNVGRTANNRDKYGNLRAELWSEMNDWFGGELSVSVPDLNELHSDLCSLGFKFRSNGQLLIESKEDAKKRGLPSPDTADALALTFFLGANAGATSFQANFISHSDMKGFL